MQASERVAAGDFSKPVMAYQEGEFSQLADALTDMMTKLKKVRRELITAEQIAAWQVVGRKVAHEIKNPLTPIEISIDDLRRSYQEKLPDFDTILNETTRTIKSEINRVTMLLDEFVSFARMTAPKPRSVDPSELCLNLESLYRSEIDAERLTINNEFHGGVVTLDPDAISQVLINLVKNGLESSEDAVVTVTVRGAGAGVEFLVADTGCGFTPEKLANSFEPYVSAKPGGSGLGLVICHRIVHDHGGSITIYNQTDGGAAVRVTLP